MSKHQDDLRSKRALVVKRAQALLAECHGAGISADQEYEFDRLMAQADQLQNEILLGEPNARTKRFHQASDALFNGTPEKLLVSPERQAFTNYLKFGMAALNAEEKATLLRGTRNDDQLIIRAAQSVGTGSGGGYAVPDEAMQPIVEAMKSVGGLLEYAHVITSDSGADMPIPTDDETSVEGEIITENSQHNEGDIALGQVVLQSFLYSSKIVRVPIQLMDDAGFDFGTYVMQKLGTRLGRVTAKHWVIGDGSSKPRGVAVAATVGRTAASPTAVTYDELVDLLHSVDPIYRRNGVWLVNDTTYASFRKLKDGQNRPLYGDLANSEPNMLLGHKVVIDPNMPSMATGQNAVAFGDLSRYFIRVVKGPRVMRLAERYADYAQVGFLAFLRADGDLVDTTAVKALQMA